MARFLLRVAFVLALAVGGAACNNNVTSPAAAEVNGIDISQDALDDELEAMTANTDYIAFLDSQQITIRGSGQGTYDAGFVRRVLTRQILLELVHQEFVRQKLELTDDDLDLVRGDIENEVGGPDIFEGFPKAYQDTLVRRSAEVAKLQLELSDATVDDAAVRAFYDENPELFVETCVRHILLAVLDDTQQVDMAQTEAQGGALLAEAQAAQARVAGGQDFAAVAAELSKDLSNKDQGGDLGCGPAGRFVPEFETAMDATAPGQVSAPVKTQFGYHLINVVSRDPKPFDEVAGEIRERLLSESSAGFAEFLTEALSAAEIEVSPRFGTFDKNLQNPSIIPPNAPTTEPVGGAPDGVPTIDLGG